MFSSGTERMIVFFQGCFGAPFLIKTVRPSGVGEFGALCPEKGRQQRR